jgi:parvulin-like peptidyl-prolyl isomerase
VEVGWGSQSLEWEAAVERLEPGALSEPIAGPEGWEIVQLVGRRTVEPPDYSKARTRLADILERRALARRRAEFVEELDRRYGLRANPAVVATPAHLAKLVGEAPATVLYRWQGGELDLATFARGLDLAALAAAPAEAAQAELDSLLRRTVNDALVRAEARRRAVAERPDVVAEVARHREALMEQVLYADHVLAGLTVPEAEVRAWYDQHPEDAVSTERRRIAQIVTRERAEAEAVAARLAAGEEFAALAREVSIDVMSGKAGGDIGWVETADMGAEFAAVAALAVGEVAGPIESKFGWHLMRLEAIEAPRPRPFEEVREALAARLLEAAKTERRTEWVRQLRAASEVVVDDAAIERWAAEVEDVGEAPPSHRAGAR